MKTNLTILKPVLGGHPGGCFRELIDMWREKEFCKVKLITEIRSTGISDETMLPESRVWVGDIGKILLYDNTRLDKMTYLKWEKALFANEVMKAENCYNWIFWPRFPRMFYHHVQKNGIKKYDDRTLRSCFIGNFTTNVRSGDWGKYIDFFSMGTIQNHHKDHMKFSYHEYLEFLATSKFGLCLAGQGPKCLRDVEVIGLGAVPIFTPGVSTDYYDPLIREKHFLYADKPEDVPSVIASCTKEQWEFISTNCLEWFERNCSLEGSFETTLRIFQENEIF